MGENGTRLSFFGGVAEVGGNKLLLESKGSRVFLDFGMSFRQSQLYFSEFLNPRDGTAFGDLWRMGMLPRFRDDLSVYRADYLRHMRLPPGHEARLDGVLLSHGHMDHVNYVEHLRPEIPIHLTHEAEVILGAIEATGGRDRGQFTRWYPSFELVPNQSKGGTRKAKASDYPAQRRALARVDARPFALGEFAVTPFAVDHSLPGAAAYVVESDDARIAYTGDLRFHGRNGAATRAFVEKASEHDVDALLVEGTRVQRTSDEVPEERVESELRDLMAATKGLVIANWPGRDVDRLVSMHLAAKATGRRLVVDFRQALLLRHMEAAGLTAPRLGADVGVFVPRTGWCTWGDDRFPPNVQEEDYYAWQRPFLGLDCALTPDDLRAAPSEYVWRCDYFGLHDLVDVEPPPGSVYVQSLTEPFNEEMVLDEKVVQNWLDRFGLGPMRRTHASGHLNAEQLVEMIRTLRPKVVYPIHTGQPEEFQSIVEKANLPSRVVLPRAPTSEEAMKGEGYFPLP